jgi:hypothetical protein
MTLACVAALAALGSLGVLIASAPAPAIAQVKVECADEQTREKVRAIVLRGVDAALEGQVVKLFSIWMSDHRSPPKHALAGMDIATNAYIRARANALNWAPPLCP